MFKNYLTYSFALKFHEKLSILDIPIHVKRRLIRSAETMVDQFSKACHAEDEKKEAMYWGASFLCLKDCREILDQSGIHIREIDGDYEILFHRLERLCLDAAKKEDGQLRMLG